MFDGFCAKGQLPGSRKSLWEFKIGAVSGLIASGGLALTGDGRLADDAAKSG
jgi:hypothetical protein